MAELGISIVENLIEVIGSEIIKEICDRWNYKDHLADLNKTVFTIKNVLLDADAKRELTFAQRGFIEELKAVVYDADDLFDEFLTLAELKQIDGSNKDGNFFEKVCRFFSTSKKRPSQASKMLCKVKDMKKQLDAIADNHLKFGFSVDYEPIRRRREESCSYVDAKDIVGREEDKKAIIDLLLQHHNTDNEGFRFLTIVGVGGLGKTALAQVVYNDDLIKNEFPDLRLWVCVSDQEGEQFDVKAILCKILELITKPKFDGSSSTMELVQNRFQEELRGKKYFLVLDDVWNEDRKNWLELKKFLILGQEGSRIVVTTRSEKTATIVGDKRPYKLKGLSQEDSWRLFEMSAFDGGCQQESGDELLEIGRKIVAKCSNVPLAIKVVGSLLFGQGISRWRSVEESGLANIGSGDNEIMSILKLSYNNLTPSLKSCFSYCALFPKDFRIRKEMLIELWMAQGYIVPLDRGQSIEDAAEEHFAILLRRCFFQDVVRNNFGDVRSFKIHDLMHDVAQEVGREEIRVVTSIANNLGDKIRHVCCVGDRCPQLISLCSNKIRSYISVGCEERRVVDIRIDKWMCLRVLDLSNSNVGSLPESIGELLHLRYLDLSSNWGIEILPNAITRLHNLQTLLLCYCSCLRELPKDFCQLIKLRHLDLSDCNELASMPAGMDKMTSLTFLPYFIVGKRNSSEVISEDELKPLKALTDMKGDISINIGNNYKKVMNDKEGEGYLKNMKHLTYFSVSFDDENEQAGCVNHEAVLETLEPPSNLKGLFIIRYSGITISKWGRADNNLAGSLSHLVHIVLVFCRNLKEMPVISKLPHLKSLNLRYLDNVEYMENWSSSSSSNTEAATIFFPSLRRLEFRKLEKLKGWWKGEPSVDDHDLKRRFRFPCLSELWIHGCPMLTSFPSCTPSLEELRLCGNNEKLQVIVKTTGDEEINVKLRVASVENVGNLKSLPTNCLTHLDINGQYLEEDSEKEVIGEAFQRCAASLRDLDIKGINNLKRLSGERGLEHFTVLESLSLIGDGDGDGEDKDVDDNTMLWKSFPQNLRSLFFVNWTNLPKGIQCLTSIQHLNLQFCKNLKALPEWISSLSSLQSLSIWYCPALESLPEAMRNLTSLQILTISDCPELTKRCKEPNGEDRPKIQHIPKIDLIDYKC